MQQIVRDTIRRWQQKLFAMSKQILVTALWQVVDLVEVMNRSRRHQ